MYQTSRAVLTTCYGGGRSFASVPAFFYYTLLLQFRQLFATFCTLHVSLSILFPEISLEFIFSINLALWQKYDLLEFGEVAYK